MGVPGLWNLLEPARRPLDLEQLSGRIVAIDMNIWLHQAVKSRAATGGPSRYLAVLFRRLCKLIYFGIRPVFVFDGEVPALKRSTMAARRKLRGQLGEKAERAQQRMLRRLLRRVAESATVGVEPDGNNDSHGSMQMKNLEQAKLDLLQRLADRPEVHKAKEDAQLFVAPTSEPGSESNNSGLLCESAGLEFDELARDYLDSVNLYAPGDKTTGSLDLHSPSFCALPMLAQLRVIQLAREQLESGFRTSFQQQLKLERDTEVFSSNQVHRLLLRRRLAERQEELSVQIAKDEASRQLAQLNCPRLSEVFHSYLKTDGEDSGTITSALRIQSRDTGHAILIKKPSPQNQFVLNRLLERKHLDSEFQDTAADEKRSGDVSLDTEALEAEGQSTGKLSPTELTVEYEPKQSLVSSIPSVSISHEPCPDLRSSTVSSETIPPQENILPPSPQIKLTRSMDSSPHIALSDRYDDSNNTTTEESISLDEAFASHTTRPISESFSLSTVLNRSLEDKADEPWAEEEVEGDFIEVTESHIVDHASEEASSGQTSSSDEESRPSVAACDNSTDFPLTQEWIEDADEFRLDDEVLREQADRFTRQAQTTTARCIDEAQHLLNLFGVPLLVGPEEAEAQCAALQRSNRVDLVATDDSDVWPFGARVVCRHLFGGSTDKGSNNSRPATRKSFLRSPSLYLLQDVQQHVGLNVPNFLRLALLCGSDYTPGVQNVGPVTAVEIISEFDPPGDAIPSDWCSWLNGADASDDLIAHVTEPLRRFVTWRKTAAMSEDPNTSVTNPVRKKWINLSLPPGFPDSRIVEAYLRPKVTAHIEPFSWKAPDVESLAKYTRDLLGWHPDQTKSMLSAVLSRQQKRTFCSSSPTMHITDYFPRTTNPVENDGSCENSDKAPPTSKRACKAISRLLLKDTAAGREKTSDGKPSTNECTLPEELQQLPYRKRPVRKRTITHSTEGEVPKTKTSRSSTRKKSSRRVVDHVALSEEEEEEYVT